MHVTKMCSFLCAYNETSTKEYSNIIFDITTNNEQIYYYLFALMRTFPTSLNYLNIIKRLTLNCGDSKRFF